MNGLGRGEKKEESKFSVVTRETVGMTFLLFAIIIFFIAVTGKYVFGDIGTAITAFFVGLLGFFVYPFLILAAYLSLSLVTGKKFLPTGWLVKGFLVTLAVFFIVHTATAERFVSAGYGGYLAGCWSAAKDGASGGTGGGVIFGIVAFPVRYLLSAPGAYIIFSLLLIASLFYVFTATPMWKAIRNAPRKARPQSDVPLDGARAYPGAVAFDDLERSMPERSVPAEQPAAAPVPPPPPVYSARATAPASSYDPSSRDILYPGNPSELYRGNLIYSPDSHFNTSPRGSTVQRPVSAQPTATPKPAQSAPESYAAYRSASRSVTETPAPVLPAAPYSEQYRSSAEQTRPQMPRKVTGTDSGYVPQDASFNYPQAPSYRAPEATGEKKPFTQPLNDPEPEQPAAPVAEQPAARVSAAPPVAPAEKVEDPRDVPTVPTSLGERLESDFARRETPAPAAPAPSRRRTSLHDFLSGKSEETKKSTPPLAPRFEERSRYEEPAAPRFEEPTAPRFEEPATPIFEERSRFEQPETPRFERTEGLRRMEDEGEETEGGMSSGENVFDARPAHRSVSELFDDDKMDDEEEEPVVPSERVRPGLTRGLSDSPRTPAPAPAPVKPKMEKYVEPKMDNLLVYDETIAVTDEEVARNVEIILETLRGFNVEATFMGAKRGPSVTQYNIDIPRNVSVSTVIRRDAEIAMRLHAQNGINIYSNPLAEAISIEVPNENRSPVSMRTVMKAEEFQNAKPNSLVFTMGMSIEGKPVCGDIVSMKHILMAGATGSGKSVMMNSMLISLLYKYSPEDLRLILIDPKKIEFGIYEGIPHLMIREVITEEKKVVAALAWAVGEMDRRYSLFEKKVRSGVNVREISEYNENLEEGEEKLPKIVIVIDELADLMATVAKDIEVYIQRIAQKARAAGMHLVLATQRPSADIITGIIKANLPTRIAFHVAQEINSRIILDETGADKLLGLGDMLYKTEKMSACERLQGVLIKSKEVEAVIKDIKENNRSYYDQSVDDFINKNRSSGGGDSDLDDKDVDEKYIRALRVAVDLGQASISLIQRKCSVGYNHAGKIIEWMEAKKYITPFDGQAKARKVLLTKEEFEQLYGDD